MPYPCRKIKNLLSSCRKTTNTTVRRCLAQARRAAVLLQPLRLLLRLRLLLLLAAAQPGHYEALEVAPRLRHTVRQEEEAWRGEKGGRGKV